MSDSCVWRLHLQRGRPPSVFPFGLESTRIVLKSRFGYILVGSQIDRPLRGIQRYTVDRLYELTKIDRWFLYRLERISNFANVLSTLNTKTLDSATLLSAKQLGFSDKVIASSLGLIESQVRPRDIAIRVGAV